MLLVANYKLNGNKTFFKYVQKEMNKLQLKGTKLVLCPPFVYMPEFKLKNKNILLGSQDICAEVNAKATIQTSVTMLKKFGVQYAIIGHSEMRAKGETYLQIAEKVYTVCKNGITPIICIGENTKVDNLDVIKQQVKLALSKASKDAQIIVAYEPVWAIGSGQTPTNEQINRAIKIIKSECAKQKFKCEVLYGGSVNEKNYNELLLSNVDGFLLGGVSLKINEFLKIVKGCDR